MSGKYEPAAPAGMVIALIVIVALALAMAGMALAGV